MVTQHTDLVRTHEMITARKTQRDPGKITLHISWLLVFWPLEQWEKTFLLPLRWWYFSVSGWTDQYNGNVLFYVCMLRVMVIIGKRDAHRALTKHFLICKTLWPSSPSASCHLCSLCFAWFTLMGSRSPEVELFLRQPPMPSQPTSPYLSFPGSQASHI